jgi:hypothetical protein
MRPQAVEKIAGCAAVLVGHVTAGEGLGEGLVLAHAEHMDLDPKCIERTAKIGRIARQATQQHEAVGRKLHLVGNRGQIVLALGEALAAREHRAPGGLEVGNGCAQFGQLGQAGRLEIVGLEHQG